MKTTLDLPDDLLIAAKQVAAQRRTTLKAMVTHSLRREIGLDAMSDSDGNGPYELSELGLPVLRRRGVRVDEEVIKQIDSEIDGEEIRSSINERTK